MPADPRIIAAVLEAVSLETGGEAIAVSSEDGRTVMAAGDHLVVITTGDLPARADLDRDEILLCVEVIDAWFRLQDAMRDLPGAVQPNSVATAAIRTVRSKLRACL